VRYWGGQECKLRAFLGALTEADLLRRIDFTVPMISFSREMAVGEVLQHAVIHSIHHRGQVTLLMRELGQPPGNVDMLLYYGKS
jgi:uncharacterized damage-inducible protein DinB